MERIARRTLLATALITTGHSQAQDLLWYHTWPQTYVSAIYGWDSYSQGPLAIDGAGNTFMTSYLNGAVDVDPGSGTTVLDAGGGTVNGTPSSICLAKFALDGTWQWTRQIGYTAGDRPWGIGVDANNNAYIAGQFRGTLDFDPGPSVADLTSAGSGDAFVAKFDNDGNYLWAHRFGSTDDDKIWDIEVDANGNSYLMLNASGTFDVDPGPATVPFTPSGRLVNIVKLDADGDLVWARTLEPSTGICYFQHIALDGQGDLAIAGIFMDAPLDADPGPGTAELPLDLTDDSNFNAFIVKWNADGEYLWGWALPDIDPRNLACAADGSVCVAGGMTHSVDLDPGPGVQMHAIGDAYVAGWILKLGPDGSYAWSRTWDTNSIVQLDAVRVDPSGHVIAAGIYDRDMDLDPGSAVVPARHCLGHRFSWITTLAASGEYLWSGQSGQDSASCRWEHLAVGPNGHIRISGSVEGQLDMDPGTGVHMHNGPDDQWNTLLLAIEHTGSNTGMRSGPSAVSTNVYPVPTEGVVHIAGGQDLLRVCVRDMSGASLLEQSLRGGSNVIDISRLAAGPYIIELTGRTFRDIRTVVKQ